MEETFKSIVGFPQFIKFEISNFGRVREIDDKNHYLQGTVNKDGYRIFEYNKKKIGAHRLVALHFLGNPDNKPVVDHKDNDRLNNKVNNLRWATISENGKNKVLYSTNTSGFKGVAFNAKSNKWDATITCNNKRINLGSFDKIEDAIKARVFKAKELYGEFLNTVEKIQYDIIILKEQKQQELDELIELEKELDAIINS